MNIRTELLWFYFCSLFAMMTIWGCQGDPCDNRNCQNGGTCIEGECQCPEGFIGPDCTIELDPCTLKKCNETNTQSCVSNAQGEALCKCKDGFEGERCETPWEAKFFGDYILSENCDGLGLGFEVDVIDGPDASRSQITIGNFHNQRTDTTSAKVVANLIGANQLDIYQQFMSFGVVSGTGSRDNDGIISLDFIIIKNNLMDTLRCSARLTLK